MKARIKKTGELIDVISRFMPKKRNVPSRDWICNLSNGACINESELEYISDNIEGNRIIDIDNVAREYAENHYSEWEETWCDYNGYNAEPENDKLQLIDAFKAGAEWMAGQGVILNLSIDELSCGAYNACVEQGLTSEDDIIVQIRKKEENHE